MRYNPRIVLSHNKQYKRFVRAFLLFNDLFLSSIYIFDIYNIDLRKERDNDRHRKRYTKGAQGNP